MTNMVSDSARRISSGELDVIQGVIEAVDQVGREMDDKWGCGRLPTLVPVEWAERFASQKFKMSKACWSWDCAETRKHGEAMVRAYHKLDELALEAGHKPGPPDVWEFMAGDQLVLLVKDIRQVNQVDRQGRQCQVWSLDEVANVIRAHPVLAAAKDSFPGATVESIRPVKDFKNDLNDSLDGLPM